ncbi:sulfatase/phosphatase domain-containing protein [Mariniflexile sp.]|uniref:sulfatase/phosphatase domain-containing protein n=1 Tax=Mariniflexile sp. TaxID=1979402 RepID=UPI00356AA065
MYGVRTNRYKLIHVYDDIDEWELYNLEKDPNELKNIINDSEYDGVKAQLHQKLEMLQAMYKVTNKEFENAPKEQINKAFKQFERLRGNTGTSYNPKTDK